MARPAAPPAAGYSAYRPPWWCRNPHLQTIWGPLFRRVRMPLRRERLATPDGDFVDLDWHAGAGRPDGAGERSPLLLVLHGLEGSSRSHYVSGLFGEAARRGWRAVALNFRSCSGCLNRLPRFYHSGDTGDLDAVVSCLLDREPEVPLVAAGVSLGGNVLLKWLGEQGERAPIRAAAAISVPFDLPSCAAVMDRGFNRAFYTRGFLRTMRAKVRDKARAFPGFVDLEAVRRSRTFAEYDRAVTAPLHGFRDEVDYWRRSSSLPYLPAIRRPALLLGALDDPFVPAAALPDPRALPDCVTAEFVEHGGHVGFVEGRPWRAGSWAERRAVAFLAAQLGEAPGPVRAPGRGRQERAVQGAGGRLP